MDYMGARRLAFEAGRGSRKPDLGLMFSLYGRGVQAGPSASQERHRQERVDELREDEQEHQIRMQGLRSKAPMTEADLQAHLDRKRAEAEIVGRTFDQQQELLRQRQGGTLGAISARGDQGVRIEGVRQENRATNIGVTEEGKNTRNAANNAVKVSEGTANRSVRVSEGTANRGVRVSEGEASRKAAAERQDDAQAHRSGESYLSRIFRALEGDKNRGVRVSEGEANRGVRVSEGTANRATREKIAGEGNAVRVSEGALNRGAANDRSEASLRFRYSQLQQAWQSKTLDDETRKMIAEEANQIRLAIAGMNDDTRRSEGAANRASREGVSEANRQAGLYKDSANREQRDQQFKAREAGLYDRFMEGIGFRKNEGEANRQARLYTDSANREQRGEISEADRQARLYMDSARRDQRGEISEADRQARLYMDSAGRESREGISEANRQAGLYNQSANREQRADQFKAREAGVWDRFAESIGLRKSEGAANRAQRDRESALRSARWAAEMNSRFSRIPGSGNPAADARAIFNRAQENAKMELAINMGAGPDVEKAIIEKHARQAEELLRGIQGRMGR